MLEQTAAKWDLDKDLLKGSEQYGDVNDDSNINIQDVILSVNIVLGNLEFIEAADVNIDATVDVLDIILIVNMILQ